MTQRIRFDKSVPEWLRRHCRRWFRALYSEEWTLAVRMHDAADLRKRYGKGVQAVTATEAAHFDISIWFADDVKDYPLMWRTVFHELRHPFFAEVTDLFDYLWDGRRKVGRADARRLLNELIERKIQSDVAVIAKLKKLP